MAATHKKILTISTRPSSSLSDQPVWVFITADTDIGGRAQSDASDVSFWTTGGVELDWRKVAWTITSGSLTAVCMVVVPSVLSSADTQIEIRYGGGAGTPSYSSTLTLSGLVCGLDMESTSPSDWSGNGNDATGSGGVGTTTGKVGTAGDFDGSNDQISVSSVLGLGANTVTVICWVYLDSTSECGAFWKIGAETGVAGDGYALGVGDTYFDLFYSSAGNKLIGLFEKRRWIVTSTNIGTGWHRVAMVIDASSVPSFYLDGDIVSGDYSGGSPDPPTAGATKIGGYTSAESKPRYADCAIDDWRAYSRVLSASELGYDADQTNSPGTWGAEQAIGGSGWSHKIHGIAAANVAKVHGVARANIAKIHGV